MTDLNCLLDVDQQVGKVLDALDASDFANNTIMVASTIGPANCIADKSMPAVRLANA